MQPAGRLQAQKWMSAPETVRVIAALTAEGAEVRFVGGCVRDAVLGVAATDIDIASHLPPDEVTRLLEAAGIKAVPTGIAHGTVTAVAGDAHFEITTLRRDVETDGRRAKVEFTNDWAADAARRDFTINAMFAAPDGTLYDPLGGMQDLHAGRVRFVGEPEQRIREDVLRLLRYFRFQAYYGRGAPASEALDACATLAPLLPGLSGERVAREIFRLLAAPRPADMFRLMAELGVLGHVLPQLTGFARLDALMDLGGAPASPILRLGALVEGGAPAADAVAGRLRLANEEREQLRALAAPPARLNPDLEMAQRRQHLYRLGAGRYLDLAHLAWAEAGGASLKKAEAGAWRELADLARLWPVPEFPLRGRDALALEVPPGPRVGRLLAAVEEWWVDGDFAAGREECLEELKRRAASPGQNGSA